MGRENVGQAMAAGVRKPGAKGKVYLAYSVLFVAMCVVIYRFFWQNGRSFIWEGDGWSQHYKALLYYAKWLRSVIKGVLADHVLRVPTFSFGLGYGADIYTTLHYYAIGDPLNLFSVLVPADSMMYFYEFLILLRLYLAGMVFMKFCFYMRGCRTGAGSREESEGMAGIGGVAVLAGAFAYVFCGYALFAAVRHPYFVNPMIYLPLVLLGVEKILREKKPYGMILSVFVCAVSNFYFFYAIVLLTVIYVGFRLAMLWPETKAGGGWREALFGLLRIAGSAMVGVLLGAAILLPVVLLFLGDARSGSTVAYDFFYQKSYYDRFLPSMISFRSIGNWTIMCYPVVTLLAIFLLFIKRKANTALKVGFLLLTGFLLLPVFGHIFNGFSYVSNRWVWGYGMLVAYILATMWDKLFRMAGKEICLLGAAYVVYALACLYLLRQYEDRGYIFSQLAIGAAAVVVFAAMAGTRRKKAEGAAERKWLEPALELLVLFLVLCSVSRNATHFYAEDEENYAADFVEQKSINQRLTKNEGEAVALLADGDFWRYTGSAIKKNSTLLNGLSSTQYYWSLANGAVAEFFKSLGIPEPLPYNCIGLDDRTMLNTMLGIRYYVAYDARRKEARVPFGYQKVDLPKKALEKKYEVYENRYALPLGYTYSGYLLREDYDRLADEAKQEAMLQAVVLDEEPEGFAPAKLQFSAEKLPYEIRFGSKNVSQQGNSFVVTKKGAYVTLDFAGQEACETYLLLNGLHFEGVSPGRLYGDDAEVDPYHLFTQEAWDALSQKEREEKEKAERAYREPTKVELSLVLTLQDGKTARGTVPYCTPKYTWYNGIHDFQINMGYHKQGGVSLKIKFPKVGIYRFEEIGIFCQPMEQYAALVSERREDVLQELDLHNDNAVFATDLVTGTITLKEPKLLFLGIPISKGWTAYVDGKKTKLQKANIIGMALPLAAGEHTIRLEYHTPGLVAGMACSAAGCCFLVGIWWYQRRKSRG